MKLLEGKRQSSGDASRGIGKGIALPPLPNTVLTLLSPIFPDEKAKKLEQELMDFGITAKGLSRMPHYLTLLKNWQKM